MCGIASIITLKKQARPLTQEALMPAVNALNHRGPDGYGTYINQNKTVALAHTRLSIIDLATGSQPIVSKDQKLALVANGEFYNFEKIRTDLETKGHIFLTKSDSEIALHLYREYGLDFIHHLRGEFAFILYDTEKERVIAARDRFGIKPLVYAIDQTTNRLYIASEAKAILALGYQAKWNMAGYAHASQLQYFPSNQTLFKGIQQVEPGHFLIHEKGKDIRFKKYWDFDFCEETKKQPLPFEEAIALVHEKLEEAVHLRMRSDVPVCYHLSGGIDSSSIAGIAAKKSTKPLDCFTVSFDDPMNAGYDELEVAKQQADMLGANLNVVRVSEQDMIDVLDDAVLKSEGLSINGHFAGKYLLNQAIKHAGFKVALSGEGSDEIFAGYPHFQQDLLGNQSTLTNAKLAGVFLSDGEELKTDIIAQKLGFVPAFLKAKASLGFRIQPLLNNTFKQQNSLCAFTQTIAHFDVNTQLKNRHVIDQSSYLWSKLTLANYILKTLGDGCEMAHSIEGRVPFLDHHLFEAVKSLSMGYKLKTLDDGTYQEKYILREAMKPYLTEQLYKRQKHPFIAPPVSATKTPLIFTKLGDLLNSQEMKDQPFYDTKKTKKWFDDLIKSDTKTKITHEPVLMMLVTTLSATKVFGLR